MTENDNLFMPYLPVIISSTPETVTLIDNFPLAGLKFALIPGSQASLAKRLKIKFHLKLNYPIGEIIFFLWGIE